MRSFLVVVAVLVLANAVSGFRVHDMTRAKGVKESFTSLANSVKSKCDDLGTAIDSKVTDAANAVSNVTQRTKQLGASYAKKLGDALSPTFTLLQNRAVDAANFVGDKAKALLNSQMTKELKEVATTMFTYVAKTTWTDVTPDKMWGPLKDIQAWLTAEKVSLPPFAIEKASFVLSGIPSLSSTAGTLLQVRAKAAAFVEEAEEAARRARLHDTATVDCQTDYDTDTSTFGTDPGPWRQRKRQCSIMVATSSFFNAISSTIMGILNALDSDKLMLLQIGCATLAAILNIISISLSALCARGGFY